MPLRVNLGCAHGRTALDIGTMKLHRFAVTALFLATAAAAGCASNPDATDDATDDESALASRAWEDLVGAYDATSGPDFQQIVLTRSIESSGHHFFANVDNGIRCIKAPCPSTDRIEGWYTAGPKTLTLHSSAGTSRYNYTLNGKGELTIKRGGVTHVLSSVGTYCDDAEDCGEQSYIHIMCAGHATCGASHSCGYTCGVPLPDGGSDAGDAGKPDADAGKDAGKGPACGTTTCAVGDVCCNPLMNICTKPGMFCIQ
jgi:hypothetical protein